MDKARSGETIMVQNWGAYHKEENCGRGKHHFVVPRTKRKSYLICDRCQSHKTLRKPHKR